MLAGVVQFAPRFGRIADNVNRAIGLMKAHPADLFVLPELATTGYAFRSRGEALPLAESVPGGESVKAFTEFARKSSCCVCFGIAEKAGGRLYDSAILVGPDGVVLHYRKNHLFLREKDVFTPGDRGFPTADLPDGSARVGALVCFDYMFPEAARSLALAGAEILLHPANLITPFGHGAMAVRSLENGVYSLLANRVGEEDPVDGPPLVFTGGSRIHGPRGEILAALGEDEEGVALAEIEPERARNKAVTPRNHLIRDRRPDLYGALTQHAEGDDE